MRISAVCMLVAAILCSSADAQLSQKEACQKFESAIVRIDAHEHIESHDLSRGTGFLVSPDGWILTAAHVVTQAHTGRVAEGVSVVLFDGSVRIARVMPLEPKMVGADFAILKIDGQNLPSLDIGNKPDEIALGSDLTIIGFPFSAVAFKSGGPSVNDRFCLSGSVAYTGNTNITVGVETQKKAGTVSVDVDVIYFQGPSVKGLSGSPIISRDTGHVVAILTSKLTGINGSLDEARNRITSDDGMTIIKGVPLEGTISGIITVMDQQLANGLGAGTGIEDPKFALRSILREYHPTSKGK